MTPEKLNTYMHELLEAHGLQVAMYEDWLLPNGEFPCMRATWFPPKEEQRVGEFAVNIMLKDKRIVDERFAGIGASDEGLKYALESFQQGSLHVFLAALWDSVYENQVEIEDWSWSGKNWKVFIGNYLTRHFEGEDLELPDNLFERVENTIKGLDLTDEIHWVRIYCGNSGTGADLTVEALLDNEPWDDLRTTIANAGWPESNHYYSLRLFMMLKPAN
ncbi:MAG: DUF6348 family protein [Filomicrobium sp.]